MSQEFENVFMQRSLFMKKPALFATLLLIILLIGCQSTPAATYRNEQFCAKREISTAGEGIDQK
ncbi:MAG: hypothetical protein D6816_12995, partial [Bacteroidetes bacterium]